MLTGVRHIGLATEESKEFTLLIDEKNGVVFAYFKQLQKNFIQLELRMQSKDCAPKLKNTKIQRINKRNETKER